MARKKNSQSDNALVKELQSGEVEFIKQPYLYAMIGGDFTLVQRSIMIEIINSLQERFNAYLKRSKGIDTDGQLSLFTEEERMKEIKTFNISASSLGIKPREYGELEAACVNLQKMNFSFMDFDKVTGTWRRTYANLFSTVTMPSMVNPDCKYKNEDKKRRLNYVEVRMDIKVLEHLCDLKNGHGYMDHIYRIARISRCKRTPSIYIYLARFAKDFQKKTVNYVELKKFLGIITCKTDENGNPTSQDADKYPRFSKFCKEIMDPIKKDLDRLAEENLVDFTFDYKPVYKGLVKRGDPEEIMFDIHLSKLGEDLRKQRKQIKGPADVWTLLRTEYKLTDTDVKGLSEMLPEELVTDFRQLVIGLAEMIKKYKPKSVKPYVITVLKNFITSRTPSAPEAAPQTTTGQQKEEKPQTEIPEDTKEWMEFMEVIQTNCTVMDYKTWLAFLQYGGYGEGTLTIGVPNSFFYTYIQENFRPILDRALQTAYGDGAKVRYNILQK